MVWPRGVIFVRLAISASGVSNQPMVGAHLAFQVTKEKLVPLE
jgi:hypothetical protein